MKLSEVFDERLVDLDFKAKRKDEAIEKLVVLLFKAGKITSQEEVVEVLKRREAMGSTALRDGIAIPHARASCVKELKFVFARSIQGVDFNALDKKPVHLIFLVTVPQEVRKEYLQLIAKIARLLMHRVFKERLLLAESVEKVRQIFEEFDELNQETLF